MDEVANVPIISLRPQERQEEFLASSADITIYGGGAGGGKTWSLLIEPLRNINVPGFGAVIFRRSIPEIINEGGMWDEANGIYPYMGGMKNSQKHSYIFPEGSRISFAHLQYEKDLTTWRGSQIALIEFDQLETFTKNQFFYMLSRNRSTCGVRPYIRATCNPEPGWVGEFLDWWIDEEGWAIPERSGRIRWMVRNKDQNYWADTKEELIKQFPDDIPKSVTFILSTIYDNQILMDKDPNYISNLQSLSYIDRMRLLGDARRGGNWKIKPGAGKLFNSQWFEIVDAVPEGGIEERFWDMAATGATFGQSGRVRPRQKTADYTASVKMRHVKDVTYVLDMTNQHISPAEIDNVIVNTASQDWAKCRVRWEEEGGSAGKINSANLVKKLKGYDAMGIHPNDDKIARAKPFAAQAYAGNVKLLRGKWNDEYLVHLHGQPDLPHDDIMDASSGAFNDLVKPVLKISAKATQGNYLGSDQSRREDDKRPPY